MTHVAPRTLDEVGELAPMLEGVRTAMGFIPTSMLTMAHMPQLTIAFSLLASTVFGADLKSVLERFAPLVPEQQDADQNLSPELVQLIALATSFASGCRYCQAHTSHSAHRAGTADAKLGDLLQYEASEHYSLAERAVLDLAFSAGRVPNESTAAHFEALRAFFSDRQIVQIVAVISLFGYLNRWNDTMATTLEAAPADFAAGALGDLGWALGKHAGDRR